VVRQKLVVALERIKLLQKSVIIDRKYKLNESIIFLVVTDIKTPKWSSLTHHLV